MNLFSLSQPFGIADKTGPIRFAKRFHLGSLVVLSLAIALLFAPQAQAQQTGGLSGSITLPSTLATLTGRLTSITIRLVSTTDATTFSTSPNVNGLFSLSNVTIGTYNVIPSLSGAVFFPSSTTVIISTQDIARVTLGVVPPLPVISGQIIGAENARPFPFALVNISSGDARITTTLDANGQFAVPVSTTGTYTITPTTSTLRVGYVFIPTQVTALVDANGVVSHSPTFAAALPKYRLRGILRSPLGEMISGNADIRVQTISPIGMVIGELSTTAVVSPEGGEFTLSVSNGTYRVVVAYGSPIPPIYTITPNNRIVNILDVPADIGEIVITNRLYLVQGRIISTNGNLILPMPQVPVRLEQFGTNLAITSATTDANGNFTILLDASRFTAIPLRLIVTLPGFTLRYKGNNTDNDLALEGLRDDLALGDILAVRIPPQPFPVRGRLVYPNNVPVLATIVALVTNANSVITTSREMNVVLDGAGNYTIPGITSGSFQISLRSPNLVFNPPLIDVFMPRDAGTTFNVQATFIPILVSGRVQTVLGTPVPGVPMRVNGSANGVSTLTDANGRYTLSVSGQYPDSRWFIFPTLQVNTFYPPTRLVVTDINSLALSSMDFRATSTTSTLPLSTISGRITFLDNNGREQGLGRVTLSDGTRTIQTDANGNYTLRDIPNGSYTVFPALSGYIFTPPTLNASILGGNKTLNQNFVARLRPDVTNRSPVVRRPINDIPVIAAATTPIPFVSVFTDADNDSLLITTAIEDPTLLRTRIRDNTLLIDALSEGNTMVSLIANDNRGGTTTASFRVTVSRPFATPTQFTREKGNINTNINAAIVIEPQTIFATTPVNGELGAFNRNCECVGSIVWTGNNAVLPVWGEDKENDIPGMGISDPISIRFVDNIQRRSKLTRAIYFHNAQPGLWPIDQAVITAIPTLEDDECKPIQNIVMSTRSEQNSFEAHITPNPVSNKATLSYTLSSAGVVNVELWNIFGQRVTVLASGYYASGEQRLDLAIDGLPSGMYICRIQSTSEFSRRNLSVLRLSVIR